MRLKTKSCLFRSRQNSNEHATNESKQLQARSEFDAAASEMHSINQIKKWLGGWCVGLFGGEVGVKSAVVRFR